jgi:putative flippase GtrA
VIKSAAESTFSRPVVRYLIVGGGTNLGLMVVYISLTLFDLQKIVASSVVFLLGVLITYVLNRGWSFRDTGSHKSKFPRYILAYGGGFIVQIIVLYIGLYFLGVHHIIAQFSAMAVAAGAIFILLKFFVFKQSEP